MKGVIHLKIKIICRSEPYGGIIFNQHTGYSFKVDKELFSEFIAYYNKQKKIDNPKLQTTMEFMAQGCRELLLWEQKTPSNSPSMEFTFSPEQVSFSITNYCSKGCEFCYSNASPVGAFFEVEKLPLVIDQLVKNRVLQITIGGGEPTTHPQLKQILCAIRKVDIIPNITTNGLSLNNSILNAIKNYCGAIAFSIDPNYSESVLDWIRKARALAIPCHLHYIVSKKTLPTIDQELQPYLTSGIERLTLLLFKPLGRGTNLKAFTLSKSDIPLFKQKLGWLEQVANLHKFQIVFDSCFLSYLNYANLKLDPLFSDYCTAARTSCSLDYALQIKPCSLLEAPSLSLERMSLREIWDSPAFQQFRESFRQSHNQCVSCNKKAVCRGGCSLYYELAPCRESVEEKSTTLFRNGF